MLIDCRSDNDRVRSPGTTRTLLTDNLNNSGVSNNHEEVEWFYLDNWTFLSGTN